MTLSQSYEIIFYGQRTPHGIEVAQLLAIESLNSIQIHEGTNESLSES